MLCLLQKKSFCSQQDVLSANISLHSLRDKTGEYSVSRKITKS